jgi:hypothetical protein
MTSRRDRHPLPVGTLAWPQGATWPQLREAALAVERLPRLRALMAGA